MLTLRAACTVLAAALTGLLSAVGFGVLDPYDAIIQAGKLTGIHVTASARPGVTGASAHFGGGPPSGLITALPPAGALLDLCWTLVGTGLALLLAAVVLAWRWRRPQVLPAVYGGGDGFSAKGER